MLYAEDSPTYSRNVYTWENFPSPVRVRGVVSLDMIQDALSDPRSGLPTIGVSVTYVWDQIQRGGIANRTVDHCLLVKNANHLTDYFHFVFTTRTTGVSTMIGVYYAGQSFQFSQEDLKEIGQRNKRGRIWGIFDKNRRKDPDFEAEYEYYRSVLDVIRNVFHT